MINRNVMSTMEEDLVKLGLAAPMTEDKEEKNVQEEDPIDGRFVTKELLNRINGLNMESLSEEDIDALLEGLKDKELSADLSDLAEETVRNLFEVKARIVRKAKSGSVSRKRTKLCPRGFRMVDGKCVRAAIAAGGAGKLKQQARKKAKWSRSGKGAMSQKRSARWAARREGDKETQSAFAEELSTILEGHEASKMTVRDELIERMSNIFDLLGEEFQNEDVSKVYGDAMNKLVESYDVGRLDEGVMDDDEFIAEVSPLVTMMRKSLSKIMDGDLGN